MKKTITAGFTFVEILVVLAVISILSAVTAVTFQNWSRAEVLKVATQELRGALLDAQSKTLGSEGDTFYGVHVEEGSVVGFTGATYSPGASTNLMYVFDEAITATSSLTGDSTEVVFSRVTGVPDVAGTYTLTHTVTGATSTLRLYLSGLIEYE